MAQPGVMFYFDIRPCIKRLTVEEKGQLFEAILDYSELGVSPDFEGMLGIAWDFIFPKLDRDSELYDHKVAQRQYAVYVREARKRDTVPIPFNEWVCLSDDEKNRLLSADIGSYPTSTSTPTPTPTSTLASTSASASTPASNPTESKAGKPPAPPRKKYGAFGWVLLTDDEYTRLVKDFGEQETNRCITYIDESAQTTQNKNKWRDWNLVIRKCHRDAWGLSKSGPGPRATPVPEYGGNAQWSL